MKIIARDEKIEKIIGLQNYDPKLKYRPIIYQLESTEHGERLIYNSLTRELLLDDGMSEEELVRHWFLIPEDMDERSMWHMFRMIYENKHPRKRFGRLSQCTILTTTGCNASCVYCYEAGIKEKHMSKETAEDVADYIKAHCAEHVVLKWFGGEPMMNTEPIRIICRRLKEAEVSFHSIMVSNGSLFGGWSIKELRDEWNLKWVQITLDGMKDRYLASKRYKSSKDMFSLVLDNMEKLLGGGIEVHCRMNLSTENAEDLHQLTEVLKERFGKYKNIKVYATSLFEGLGSPPLVLTEEERARLYDAYMKLQEHIWDVFPKKYGIPALKRTHCMADDGRSCVIFPDGQLGLCEHHAEDEHYGTIYSAAYDFTVIDRWQERAKETKECAGCFYYPQCVRLANCPTEVWCTKEQKKVQEHRIRHMMKGLYERSKQK